MIKIFKLSNGNEIIGEVAEEELTNNEFYNIMNPMLIIGADDDYGGGMRLRDAMLLSDEELLTVPVKHCILYYSPSKVFSEYYEIARVHYRINTKKEIEEQIRESTSDLAEHLQEKERRINKSLRDILTRLGDNPRGKLN